MWLARPKSFKKSIRINNLSGIALTKIDVLDQFDEISICTDYGEINYETFDVQDLEFMTLPGWQSSTEGITDFTDLPENARKYIETIENLTDTSVDIISTGLPETKLFKK